MSDTPTPALEEILYPKDNGAVRVRVTVRDKSVTVECYCLPGYSWWSCPDSATLRRMVDRALRGTGRRRSDTRTETTHNLSGWNFRYPTTEETP